MRRFCRVPASPRSHGPKIAHVTTLEDDDDPSTAGQDNFDAKVMRARLREFEPYYQWHVGESLVDPIDAGARSALETFATGFTGGFIPGCWQAFRRPHWKNWHSSADGAVFHRGDV